MNIVDKEKNLAAPKDMKNIANFMNKTNINSVVVTLDTHSRFHIGNVNAFEKVE